MSKRIRALPFFIEFAIVSFIGFGYFFYTSLAYFFYCFDPTLNSSSITISNNDILELLETEFLSFLVILWFLWVRGWRIQTFNITINIKLTLNGILLYIGVCLCSIFIFTLFTSVLELDIFSLAHPLDYSALDRGTILLCSLINPFFEEILVTGYIVKSLKTRQGFWFAIHTSIFVRLLCHLYMGPMVIVLIFPMGVLFAYSYARWDKLWPIIVAHIVADIMGFMVIVSST